ncbi:roundabout homolog 1 isoform X1 [Hemiscyllium ocellatum]|uniref:roundabout homolog 1 isoform X1 n=1 Tax=Hemiscyllium ocellatum TaxID=170820 RepID=UPI00296777C3|nr:roundabout homolog 1 isoform X1 [Hemiscyllium ocellatum]
MELGATRHLKVLLFWRLLISLEGSRLRLDESPPLIIEHPTDLAVCRGEPATLNCRAEGKPPPVIEWYRNGERVETSEDDPQSQRTLLPHGSLFFYQLNQGRKGKSDEGIYTCVARNRLGYVVSNNASLYVASLRDDFRLQPSDVVVALGEQAEIQCLPPRGYPEPTVTWKKNGAPLNVKDDRYRITVGKLIISQTHWSDSGVYICIAMNKVGRRESRAARMSILEKPTFVQRPSGVTVTAGDTVTFPCEVRGDPMPRVHWLKENGDLPTGRYEVNSDNTITIHYTTLNDAGRYTCLAENLVGAASVSVSLFVQDAVDSGQRDKEKDTHRELLDVRIYLDNVTVLPSSAHVYLHWKVISPSQYIEGFIVSFRSLLPLSVEWMEQQVAHPLERSMVLTSLKRGYMYEFKIQAYSGRFRSPDSNTKHGKVPEEVPDAAPHSVIVATTESRNGSIVISWEPPPPESHNGIIKGYKVWCFGNETQHHRNWTVDGSTHRLEIPALNSGIEYHVQIAAINGAGVGVHTKPQSVYLDPLAQEKSMESSILGLVLEIVKQPVFIASAGSVLWVILMIFSACLYWHRRTRSCQIQKKRRLSKGLYRLTNEDIIIKHRMNLTDSPWLSNSWKSNSCSKSFSPGNSQPLWLHGQEKQAYWSTGSSIEKDQGLRDQNPLILPDNSLYGTFSVDIKGKDLKTFSTPLSQRSTNSSYTIQVTPNQSPLPLLKNNTNRNNINSFGQEVTKLQWKPTPYRQANPESWDKNCNNESNRSVITVGRNPVTSPGFSRKGDGKKVMKTFCSPKAQHHNFRLKLVDALPPPPPLPVEQSQHIHSTQQGSSKSKKLSESSMMSAGAQREGSCSPLEDDEMSYQTTCYSRLSTATLSLSANDGADNSHRPEPVDQFLELTDEGNLRHFIDSSSSFQRPFSPPHTYGYICGPLPSDLETDDADYDDEDDDLDVEVARVNSRRFFHRLCRTPTSSISECESSLAGSLANGWGSVSEDNFTSARCSMVSSSDGSFLMDANFAQALAVAVDSFCFSLKQTEMATPYAALPAASSMPAAFSDAGLPCNRSEGSETTSEPGQIWDWNMSWADEIEDRISQKEEMAAKKQTATGKDPSGLFNKMSGQQQQAKYITGESEDCRYWISESGVWCWESTADGYNSKVDIQANPALNAVHVSFATVGAPVHKSFAVRRKVEKVGLMNFPTDTNGLTMVKV